MDELWKLIQGEAQRQVPDTAVMTKVIMVAEFISPTGTRRTVKMSSDAAFKRLTPWDAGGLYLDGLNETMQEMGTTPP